MITDAVLDLKHKNGSRVKIGGLSLHKLFSKANKANKFELIEDSEEKIDKEQEIAEKIKTNFMNQDETSFIDYLLFLNFDTNSKEFS